MKERQPAKRIDGARAISLVDVRSRRALMRQAAKMAPPIEDTRVADAWARQDRRDIARKRDEAEEKRTRRLKSDGGGKEGTRLSAVSIKISAERRDRMAMRSRPGTFEWRYGRNKQDALFHVGSCLARLWEKAGMTVSSSSDLLKAPGGSSVDIPESRLIAIDELKGFRDELGVKPSERLIDYCVSGLTTAEIAVKHGTKERDMAPVLHQDLRDCAGFFLRHGLG